MKNKIYYIFAALLFLSSCSLDINEDPNNLSKIPDAKVLLPSSELTIAANLMAWDTGFGAGYWSQYMAQNPTASQFKSYEDYLEQDFSELWTEYMAGSLNDLKEIKEISDENGQTAYSYVAEILQIYSWQIMVDTWGKVPYTEALDVENTTEPKFDEGEDVYADLITRINAVVATDISTLGGEIDGEYDFLCEGDLSQWQSFAHVLKLKLMLRESETSVYDNASVLSYVQSTNFTTNGVTFPGSVFEDAEGKRHPMAEFQASGANFVSQNVIASKTLLSFLETNNDPRISSIYTLSDDGVYRGALQGDYNSTVDVDNNGVDDADEEYSSMDWSYDTDIPLISLWEQEFYIAEVYARANDMANAKAHYDAAVAASLAAHGVSGSITGAGEYAEFIATTTEGALEQIGIQKWVAYCKYQHLEAFFERNRLKYPSLVTFDVASDRSGVYNDFPAGHFTVSVQGRQKLNVSLPASPIYPTDVLSRNTNAPSQKTSIGEAVWWNQKPEVNVDYTPSN